MGRLSDSLRTPLEAKTARRAVDEFFSEEPVDLSTFVRDRKFLGNPPLSQIQYAAVRHVEQVYLPELYPFMVEEFGAYWSPVRFINKAVLMWGKGSGKDHVCRICSLRIAYLLLCLRSPQEYFEMPPQDTIHMLNVASSAPQASQAFFTPMTRAVKRGWFDDKCEPHMNTISFDKNVEAVSGHSDAESQEGLNLILGIADEIDAFKTKAEYLNRPKSEREPTKTAEGILDMMRTSSTTRFPVNFKNLLISYPRYLGSTIMKQRSAAELDLERKGEESRQFFSGPFSTWEVNPRVKGKESFAEDYEQDPVLARAKYECKPARAIAPYFRNDTLLLGAFREVARDPIIVSYRLIDVETDKGKVQQWQAEFDIDGSQLVPITGAQYALHGDIAISKDRAGLAMSHVSRWVEVTRVGTDEEGGHVDIRETRPVVKNDFTLSFEADISDRVPVPREIQIRWYRDLVWELIRRGFNIQYYTFDGYQSTDAMQILEQRGIETEAVSMDKDDTHYRGARDVIYDLRLEAPYRTILVNELQSVQQMPNGKIDHPPGGSKDEADALVGSIRGALLKGGSESADREEATPAAPVCSVVAPYDMPLGFDQSALDPHRSYEGGLTESTGDVPFRG